MSAGAHCFEVLIDRKVIDPIPSVVVTHGDDAFLRRETANEILALAGLAPDEVRSLDGEECKWIDIHDELATMSLFDAGHGKIVSVFNADKLVKEARVQLEKWCARPAPSSVLLLQPQGFPANTKLYKLVSKIGWCVDCSLPTTGARSKAPSLPKLKDWILAWGKTRHALELTSVQATLILDAVGTDCGILHQELGKLALYSNSQGKLSDRTLRENLGTWRTRTMWEIADAIVDGNIREALENLEKVFAAGEHPAAVVPQISWSLRRFGRAAHLILQAKRLGKPVSVTAAIRESGFWGNDAKLAEQRLRRIGLRRAAKLLDGILELDLKIKGSHSQPKRAMDALEQLCWEFL